MCFASMKVTKKQAADVEFRASIMEYFAQVPDPRVERTRHHPLVSVLVLSLCAVICGADDFVAIERFGRAKRAWLKTFLDLPHGIPSHDTIGRIFGALNPAALREAFRGWVLAVHRLTRGEVVAIDGKTLRRSFREAGSGAFVHMVSAWATSNHVVLGQLKTEEKSNEITAIPELLKLLEVKGCLVTIDAMGCQKEIASQIVERQADYLIAVKDNQPTLRGDLENIFAQLRRDPQHPALDFHQTRDTGHGRVETRRCWTTDVAEAVTQAKEWSKLATLVMIESERTADGKTTIEQRYSISSRRKLSAKEALRSARAHWGIENGLHWVLDVAFREDDCRVRVGYAAENFAVMRHIAVNLLKAVEGIKVGIKNRRLCAGWDHDFMLRVLVAGKDVG
jgi:predicted transposase YbfD/YdcC